MGAEIGDLDKEGAYASDSSIMILTCPECATRYFVDDARIGPQGREVRCAACGNRWTASRELAAAPAPALDSEPATEPDVDVAEFPVAAHPTLADELPKAFRQRAQTRMKEREAAATGVIWAGFVGGLAVLVAAIIFFRQDIAGVWPRAAGAYALVGLPVNLVGLTIEAQHAQPMLKDGHAAVAISGALRNVRSRPVAAPPLRITLLAPGGRVVATQIADPGAALIPPGEARHFVVDMLDPPVSATDVEIAFVFDGRPLKPRSKPVPAAAPSPPPAPAAATGAPTANLDLRGGAGPSVQEATPLPSSSPYALPSASAASADHG